MCSLDLRIHETTAVTNTTRHRQTTRRRHTPALASEPHARRTRHSTSLHGFHSPRTPLADTWITAAKYNTQNTSANHPQCECLNHLPPRHQHTTRPHTTHTCHKVITQRRLSQKTLTQRAKGEDHSPSCKACKEEDYHYHELGQLSELIELCADKGNAPLVGGIAMFIEVGGIGIAIAIAGCCPGCPTPGG